MKNLKFFLGVLFMGTLSVTAFSQTRSGNDATGSGKPAREQASGREHDHNHDHGHDHKGGKGNKGKGHAYGKNKGDISGREFGQQRSQDARNKDGKDKKPAQQPAGTAPSGSTGTTGRDGK